MPRYYFNVYDGDDVLDQDGIDFSDLKEVRLHMIRVALNLIDKVEDHELTWQMEVLDERGNIVGTMDFGLESDVDAK